jgi:hypothetical protein
MDGLRIQRQRDWFRPDSLPPPSGPEILLSPLDSTQLFQRLGWGARSLRIV